nr:DUF1799 domain-containing protein [Diaphorobacter sp. HDW4B]
MAAFGFKRTDYADEGVEVWPENEQAFQLFFALRRQWRVSDGVAFGIDHNVLFARVQRLNLSDDDARQLEDDVVEMESEALAVMNEERETRAKQARKE